MQATAAAFFHSGKTPQEERITKLRPDEEEEDIGSELGRGGGGGSGATYVSKRFLGSHASWPFTGIQQDCTVLGGGMQIWTRCREDMACSGQPICHFSSVVKSCFGILAQTLISAEV